MKSYLVIGMGRFGSSVATELYQRKNDVLVLDEHEEKVAGLVDLVSDVIIGDAKDEAVLRSLDIDSFDCVIVAMAGIVEDSVLTTITLKEMGAKMIVCKAQNDRHAKILTQLGADRVIQPEHDMGKHVAQLLTQRNVVESIEISSDYGIIEVVAPKRWVNKSVSEIHLRRNHGVSVIAIRSAETGEVSFSPGEDAILREGDILTMIGTKKDLDTIGSLK